MIASLFIGVFLFTWVGFCLFGRRRKKWSWTISLGGGFIVACFSLAALAFLFVPSNNQVNKTIHQTTSEEKTVSRKELIEKQFSSWDGSHYKLEAYIKSTMNDPDSYQHIKTVYLDKGDYLLVKTTFRGKNVFNALVIDSVIAMVGLDGEVWLVPK
jgi:hypothetical protein